MGFNLDLKPALVTSTQVYTLVTHMGKFTGVYAVQDDDPVFLEAEFDTDDEAFYHALVTVLRLREKSQR